MTNVTQREPLVLWMCSKMPDGAIRDADTILQDIMDNAERKVSGTGAELIQLYLDSTDRSTFRKMFEAMTGVTWDDYINQCYTVMADIIENNKPGEWLDVKEETVCTPDKSAPTYITSQTCSCCGTRSKFVGQASCVNAQYCPVCGKQMTQRWVFQHVPTIADTTNIIGFAHENDCDNPTDAPVAEVAWDPKDINELNPRES